MAAITLLGSATVNTTSGTKTITATPAVGDLILLIVANTGTTADITPTDNNSDTLGNYSLLAGAVKNSSADGLQIFARNALIGSASSTVFTQAPGTTTGGGLIALKVTGMARVGASAARQSATQSNQAASGTPTPVLGLAASTINALVGAIFNATNPATMTPRSGWSERSDVGYATPTTGLEVISIDSGETATSIAWGGTSASAFAALVVELDIRNTLSLTQSIPDASLSATSKVISSVTVSQSVDDCAPTFIVQTQPSTWNSKPRHQWFVDTRNNSVMRASVRGTAGPQLSVNQLVPNIAQVVTLESDIGLQLGHLVDPSTLTASIAVTGKGAATQAVPDVGMVAALTAIASLSSTQSVPLTSQTITAAAITSLTGNQAIPDVSLTATVGTFRSLSLSQTVPDAALVATVGGSGGLRVTHAVPDAALVANARGIIMIQADNSKSLDEPSQTATAVALDKISLSHVVPDVTQTATMGAVRTIARLRRSFIIGSSGNRQVVRYQSYSANYESLRPLRLSISSSMPLHRVARSSPMSAR